MTDEERTDALFREVYKQVAVNHKDFCTNKWGHENFHKYHDYADKLISFGLIQYTDNEKLRVCITEKGERIGKESSYLLLMQQEERQNQSEGIKEEVRTELDKVNLMLAKKQLRTFWLTFLIALLSLIISLIALFR